MFEEAEKPGMRGVLELDPPLLRQEGAGGVMSMHYRTNDSSLKGYRRELRKNQTDAERRLWQKLRNKRLAEFKFFRQYSFGPFILDFYCPRQRLAIELDGSQHLTQQDCDRKRSSYLERYGIEVIRFWDNDVLQNTEEVIEGIWQKLMVKKGNEK